MTNIQEWIHEYLKDHDRLSFSNDVTYRKNHGVKYKNVITDCSYSIHPHNIPSYILGNLKRGWKAKELK